MKQDISKTILMHGKDMPRACGKLDRIRIELRPTEITMNGNCEFRISIERNGIEFTENYVMNADHFKSIAENAFDECVRKMRRTMGWEDYGY